LREEEGDINPYKFLDEITASLEKIEGLDLIYFLDNNFQMIKEKNSIGRNNYLGQVLNIIGAVGKFQNGSKPFHTYTLLNENGLVVISKMNVLDGIYMVVVGGEDEPVDLIGLLKIVKDIPSRIVVS